MDNPPSGIKPEPSLAPADRASDSGALLNVPPIPASNSLIGERHEHSRVDGTSNWKALGKIMGGL
jgi:cystathionine gamma-synthase